MDGGAKCSVTNIIDTIHNVTWFDKRNPSPVKTQGDTSKKIIVSSQQGLLHV